MPQNTPFGIPRRHIRRLRPVYIALWVFIFIAANSMLTFAKDAPDSSCPKRFSLAQLARILELDCAADVADLTLICKEHAMQGAEVLQMAALINQERMDAGLSRLELDPQLTKLAGEKSRDMVRYNYFGHYSKQLGTVYDQLERNRFPYQAAAENLIGAPNYLRAQRRVLSSPAHLGNILNPHFRKLGIGIVRGGPYGEMIVQILVE